LFEALGDKLSGVFDNLTGRGALSEKDVATAMREIRVALLEADVALPVVKDFIEKIKVEAVGEKVIKSVKPGQQIVKIVHDGLVDMLGGTLSEDEADIEKAAVSSQLNLAGRPPVAILMAGLQGSGKTTSTGKIGKFLKEHGKRKVLLASLDTNRPAAMEQLGILAEQTGTGFLPIVKGQSALEIAKRAMSEGAKGGYDVVFLDTAGRTTINDELMNEVAAIAEETKPIETLLVADALTGQDAVETAKRFHARLPLTGLVLTRIDGAHLCQCALSQVCRSNSSAPAKSWTGLKLLMLSGLPDVSWGKATLFLLLKKPLKSLTKKKLRALPRKWKRGRLILTTSRRN